MVPPSPDAKKAGRPDVKASYHFVEPSGEDLTALMSMFASEELYPPAIQVRSVKNAAAAQDENKARHVRGKIVLKIDF